MRALFAERRRQLYTKIGVGNLGILLAAKQQIRNGDSHYAFRQHSDFYYLTDFEEPDAIALFVPGRKAGEFILFVRPTDLAAEQWDGPRAGIEGAKKNFGADEAFPIADFFKVLPDILPDKYTIFHTFAQDEKFDQQLLLLWRQLKNQTRQGIDYPQQLADMTFLLQEMRLIKQPEEIVLMRQAAQISAKAHIAAMQACQPGMREYALEAILLQHFYTQGCRGVAYTPIVASGKNACVLHYVSNNQPISAGELVLIDAGGEYHGYASDITRTFPANGQFTAPQRAIYELVLKAQLAGIDCVKPGILWSVIQETMVSILTEGLISLGILKGDLAELLARKAYRTFYMHGSGHWLGLDVHDAGAYQVNGNWRALVPGMVLTVEPGLYFNPNDQTIPEPWRGIGIRIEDDVLVTSEGHDVLSRDVPKQIAEIEALMRRK